ncbi:hypothetical protein LWC33_13740 [Pseudonocardia sp. RS11V-5]|uniref:hypothetical protein n=1 Tax=Pseudonocardia terrae TaxID=2905831 RepID=UPI001E5066E2|nr:hypothetical protein [Pseudonocardia terrae]MCE3552518.1 hypothetical protein [Pseudonocardia terrae]
MGCTSGPRRFDRRRIEIGPGESRPHVEAEWRGVLVVLEAGEIELRCHAGGHRRFAAGSVLWFTGLNLSSVHNPGAVPAVILAVSRGGHYPDGCTRDTGS